MFATEPKRPIDSKGTALLLLAVELVRGFVPGFRIVPKADSWFQRFLGWVSFWNREYMTGFWTTLGYTSYYPELLANAWVTVLHEGLHAVQAKRYTRPLFMSWYLLSKRFRYQMELAAYRVQLCIDSERGPGAYSPANLDYYVGLMTGPAYGGMVGAAEAGGDLQAFMLGGPDASYREAVRQLVREATARGLL